MDSHWFGFLCPVLIRIETSADPGSEIFHPWSRVKKIPDPDPHKRVLLFLTRKISKLSEIWSGMFIPDLNFLPISELGSRGQKGTGSRIRIRNPAFKNVFFVCVLNWSDFSHGLQDNTLYEGTFSRSWPRTQDLSYSRREANNHYAPFYLLNTYILETVPFKAAQAVHPGAAGREV